MEFFIIVSVIIYFISGYFLGRLFADGHKIRKVTDQIVFASPYIEHAAKMRRWAADRIENEGTPKVLLVASRRQRITESPNIIFAKIAWVKYLRS